MERARNAYARSLAAAALICISTPVWANPEAGDSELQLGAGFFHAQDSDSGTLTGDASYGYFLSEMVEVGIRQGISAQFIESARDQWNLTTIPFVDVHFTDLFGENSTAVPFVGAFAGAVYNDQDATGTIGPNAGIKFFLTEEAFLVTRYRYEWFFDELDLDDVTDESSNGNHVVNIGLGVMWGP